MKLQELARTHSIEAVVLGAGLAGSECAWQLAERGHKVMLIEQRPHRGNAAHTGPLFAELVCSNSLKSRDPESAPGLLKWELQQLGSLILKAAESSEVPAGQALAVDRVKFSQTITDALEKHPNVTIVREPIEHYEQLKLEGPKGLLPVVVCTGPLTSEDFAKSLSSFVGENLYFYDAIAPIVDGSTIDSSLAFLQNRYDKDLSGENVESSADGDYYNCPFTEEQFAAFIEALKGAEKVEPHDFEKAVYVQGCQPIEAILERGDKSLLFGPMKPVGLTDPRTNARPFAVVQLRKEDNEGRAWSMVGFQTKLKYPEQKRIFAMIPGLEKAEFYRMGSLHRNTFIHSPSLLDESLRLRKAPWLRFAGQITGVEGYLESCAVGAYVARMTDLELGGQANPPAPPQTTALGALVHAVYNGPQKNFQPMNINWGLVPLLEINPRDKQKKLHLVERAQRHFKHWTALF
ncbi:MAG: methylenetetrahydrofolate--tRNA-(uracil(54)-C(5))-methyltransferase (FADH(2)-oxidizing) TrmFO [Bdellovibrionota bacterium]